jgi:phosphoglycerate dehydrogenase-like enzyme
MENRSYGMPNDRNATFRVGVTRDVRRSDGTFTFAPFDLSPLDDAGIEWQFLEDDTLTPDALADVDGLYHYAAPLPTATLDGIERLAVIARHGVGLDFLDVGACAQRGIAVTITPAGVTRPMASSAVTLVLALAHRLRERDRALHEGDWGGGRFRPQGTGLTGRTLGVIGYGRIGRETVRLLRPWELRVLVTQRTPVAEERVTYVPLEELLREADFVVVACPLTDETRGLLDRDRLALMKPSAFLVNVARGAIVDQEALVGALQDGRLAGAGIDVVDPEPLPADDPLLSLPNVVGAPHSLGYTDELIRGCVEQACESLIDVASGRAPRDLANPEVLENPRFTQKLERFRDRG